MWWYLRQAGRQDRRRDICRLLYFEILLLLYFGSRLLLVAGRLFEWKCFFLARNLSKLHIMLFYAIRILHFILNQDCTDHGARYQAAFD